MQQLKLNYFNSCDINHGSRHNVLERRVNFLHDLHFDIEDGCRKFLENVGSLLPDYIALYSMREDS
jgi:hypothetical protein